ncbi:MAG TPA: MBL fold metallo-hydrolase [Candidatus Nanopusillus sp.]|nr:MBL fold metallo-hydrolase [Candidatus Nanopusillus sp.]HIP89951.1 MBL fold metallo-hydrolase [Candidatus Nanopusillus sp.]
MIRFIALGTGATFPTENRNHPSFYFEYKGIGILFDCGENTQRQFRIAKLSPTKLRYILITHWHGDHVLGLPGLLFNLANLEYNKRLGIILPKGYKDRLLELIKIYEIPIDYDLDIIEVEKDGIVIDEKEFYINAMYVKHSVPTLAYYFKQKDYWRLYNSKLKEYGLYGKHGLLTHLKEKNEIEYRGKKIKIEEVGYIKKGFKFTYITDTLYFNRLIDFARDSDILVIESTYIGDPEKAKEHFHMDFSEAYKVFKNSNSNIMLVTHVSQRYEEYLDTIEQRVQTYDGVYLIRDFDKFWFEKNIITLELQGKTVKYLRDEKSGKNIKI